MRNATGNIPYHQSLKSMVETSTGLLQAGSLEKQRLDIIKGMTIRHGLAGLAIVPPA